jgi:predicted transcriptional regulator
MPEFGSQAKTSCRSDQEASKPKINHMPKILDATDIGALIRSRREALKIKQGDLASIAGIDQGNLSKIERGSAKATLDTYLRLCNALGIDLLAEPRA